ncbi:MAG: RNA polymerase subunit sigma-70 [Acidobacteria bacterium]|nr:RNA polymerase subunit sigma-70 [Bryobacteraceae bacterium CoA2 C42]MCA2964677.1 RNA polymerase subunit sigma-70 [Acidobacteriaceae bacterium]
MQELVENLFRREAGQMVASLTRSFGPANLSLAEDAVQEALIRALRVWPYRGVPPNPAAWLHTAARHYALDQIRRAAKQPGLEPLPLSEPPSIDDTLQLILLCCHPAIPSESHVALILKTVSGFSVAEIARAFLSPPETIAQRLVRAKRIIREQGLQPNPDCLEAVHAALYLMFNAGYPAGGEHCEEAIRLTDCLLDSGLGTADTQALRALFLFHAARFPKSASPYRAVLGYRALEAAMQASQLSPWHLEAGIAAAHLWRPIDWPHIVMLYSNLHDVKPTAIVRLNWAVALSQAGEHEEARAMLAAIAASGELNGYPPFEAILRAGL